MHEYLCVDGPLGGQQLAWPDPPADGELLTIAVVDVGQPDAEPDDEPELDYRVERVADPGLPGRLRFVAGRGPWRAVPGQGYLAAG